MADITPYTNQIRSARYGEEVRGSIVNALEAMNTDINSDTASARAYATAAAQSAITASNAETNLQEAITAAEETEEAIRTAEAQRVIAEEIRQDAETGYVAQCREYAERAETAITAYGVTMFNRRTGNVLPEAGDYTADMVTYGGDGTVKGKFDAVDSLISGNTTDISNNASAISTLQSQMSSSTTITTADGTIGTDTSVANANIKQCRLLKIGKLVFCNLSIQFNGTDYIPNNTTLFTLPEGYRPIINYLPGGLGYDSSNVFHVTRFRVNADGVINYADYNNMRVLQLNYFWRTS